MQGSEELSDDDFTGSSLFCEPDGYRAPPSPPRYVSHNLRNGHIINLRLVGKNPLWGHYVWNGARTLSDYIEQNPFTIRGKTVLELGAGAGLPGIVSAVEGGAKAVLLTDYPDHDLIENLEYNILSVGSDNQREGVGTQPCPQMRATGYLWGDKNVDVLLTGLTCEEQEPGGFDVLLLADLNFNHHCHEALIDSICWTLKRKQDAKALVFFTPYRPWLLQKDMALFDVCRKKGLEAKRLLEEKVDKVMFEEDPGCEEMRRTVFGFEVTWTQSELKQDT